MSFHLLIVDEEASTRETLSNCINWKELNIYKVISVSNATEALEIIKIFQPNILLSDVNLSDMTGIELANRIREQFPECKILFLSAYTNKEYLLSAIELKAESYIEKPIHLDQIKSSLSKCIHKLKAEQIIQNAFNETLSIIHFEIASLLIDSENNWDVFSKKFIPVYFNWTLNGDYRIVCINVFHKKDYSIDLKDLTTKILAFSSNHDFFKPLNCFASNTSNHEIFLILKEIHLADLNQYLILLQKHLHCTLSIETTIGISNPCSCLSDLPKFYYNTTTATLYESFYYGRQYIFECGKPIKPKLTPKNLFNKKNLYISGTEYIFQALLSEKYTDIHTIRIQLFELYTLMMERTINDNSMSWNEFNQFTLNEYNELICYGMKAFQILGNNNYDIKIKNAIHFILWNYGLDDLSIKMIADQVGLSQNYLCSLFKKQTNSTINDFIIQVRMDKAKGLLEKTDSKLYEISEKVGIPDSNYLSALFKKHYKMTPSQYRHSIHSTL